MIELIDRQAVIDALEKLSANYTGIGKREWHPHVRECQREIKALPSAQQWIPISEKKPEDKKIVLVCSKNGKYHIGFRYDDNWWFQDIDRQIREKDILPFVWAYLPEPWEG